jgi:hypothetical protein
MNYNKLNPSRSQGDNVGQKGDIGGKDEDLKVQNFLVIPAKAGIYSLITK